MKKFGVSLLALAVAGLLGSSLLAQPPEGRRDGDRERAGERGPRDGEGRGERGPRDGEGRGERGPRDGEGRPGDRPPRDGEGRPGERGEGGRGFGPPPNPIVTALDTDSNVLK